MAKTEITKTELVWPGKYDEEGRLNERPRASLPFQVVEASSMTKYPASSRTRRPRRGVLHRRRTRPVHSE
jgi:hypothetical protein